MVRTHDHSGNPKENPLAYSRSDGFQKGNIRKAAAQRGKADRSRAAEQPLRPVAAVAFR